MIRKFFGLMVLALGISGCGSPMLHSASTAGTRLKDAGIVGEWVASDPMDIRAVISSDGSGPPAEPYTVSLTVRDKGELKTSLTLELSLTQIGESRYADLFLARTDRDKLVGSYGFLAVPVHQVLKVVREGDTLRAWQFQTDWSKMHSPAPEGARDRVTIGGGEVHVITAPTEQVRELLARHGDDPDALGEQIVFHRAGR